MPGLTIVGTGRYLPGKPVTNDDLARVMDTSDAWIRPRSGIAQRHFVAEGEGASDLGVQAAREALAAAGLAPDAVDYIIVGTMTPEYVFPGSGSLLGAKLGIPGVPALDIRQQCAAMPFAFQIADGLMATGAASTILLVGAEAHAGFMPWDWDALENHTTPSPEAYAFATKHRGTAVLFGDGAGAMVLRRTEEPGRGLLGVLTRSDGRFAEQVYIPGGLFTRRPYWKAPPDEHVPVMKGPELFKSAVTLLPKAVRALCDSCKVTLDDVDWFLAHQANDRINQAVRQSLGVPAEKVPSNIARYGNTSAGTIPILLDELVREGRVKQGQLVCMLGLGAGLNWGVVLLRM